VVVLRRRIGRASPAFRVQTVTTHAARRLWSRSRFARSCSTVHRGPVYSAGFDTREIAGSSFPYPKACNAMRPRAVGAGSYWPSVFQFSILCELAWIETPGSVWVLHGSQSGFIFDKLLLNPNQQLLRCVRVQQSVGRKFGRFGSFVRFARTGAGSGATGGGGGGSACCAS
jgi:hypothetical protein